MLECSSVLLALANYSYSFCLTLEENEKAFSDWLNEINASANKTMLKRTVKQLLREGCEKYGEKKIYTDEDVDKIFQKWIGSEEDHVFLKEDILAELVDIFEAN